MEKLCRNCKFWQKWELGSEGDCLKFYPDGELNELEYGVGNGMRASYDDSVISTGPNFGCIHFEANDGKTNNV